MERSDQICCKFDVNWKNEWGITPSWRSEVATWVKCVWMCFHHPRGTQLTTQPPRFVKKKDVFWCICQHLWFFREIQVNQMERFGRICCKFNVIRNHVWDIDPCWRSLRGSKVFESAFITFAVLNLPYNHQGLWKKDVYICSFVSICESLVKFTLIQRSDMMWFDVKMMWFCAIISTSSPRIARYVAQKCWTLFPTCPRWSTYPETSRVYKKVFKRDISWKICQGLRFGTLFGGGWNTVYGSYKFK